MRPASALPFYSEAARIFGELAKKAPGFAQWAKEKQQVELELAVCRSRVQAAQPRPGNAVSPPRRKGAEEPGADKS
jgi:hypothetical protein